MRRSHTVCTAVLALLAAVAARVLVAPLAVSADESIKKLATGYV